MLTALKTRIALKLGPNSRTFRALRAIANPRVAATIVRQTVTKSSIFDQEEDLHACSLLPQPLLDAIISSLHPQTVLDVGCGTGKSLDYLVDKGVAVQGVEGSPMAIEHASHPELILRWDLNGELKLDRRFDLVWCFEVAEHIHPKFVQSFVRTLTNHSGVVIMSAAHPGQGGQGHFNEQPREYWIELFASVGYSHNDALNETLQESWNWYPENLFTFQAVN